MLETELAQDPDDTAFLPDLLDTICKDPGVERGYEKLAADLATPDRPGPDASGQAGWPHAAKPARRAH